MSVTATYNPDIGRVQLVFNGFDTAVDQAKVERLDPNGVTWSVIRGGDVVAVTAGAGAIDDFEFVPGVLNTYRVSGVDTGFATFVAQGAQATGNNTALVPALPAGLVPGDTMLLFAAIQNSGTGTPPATITGWTQLVTYGPVAIYSRRYVTGDVAPTVTFVGGAVGASTSAYIAAWRNMLDTSESLTGLIPTSQQNVPINFITLNATGRTVVSFAWKQNGAATAGSTLVPGFTSTVTLANALGSGQSLFYSYRPADGTIPVLSGQTLTVTGGVAAISRSLIMSFAPAPYQVQQTATITPTFAYGEYWLKNPSRPGLNIPVTVVDIGDISRPARTATFDVLGRTLPVAVTDVQGSRRFDLTLDCPDNVTAADMDNRLSTGDPMFLQGPGPNDNVPTVYFVAGDVTKTRDVKGCGSTTFTIPVTEVARPGNTVYGLTYVWQDVINGYATWADVLAAVATWSDLISKVSNTVVIVS
jgi:hypothetical protein